MSKDKDDKKGPDEGEERTVFVPGGGPTVPPAGGSPAEPPAEPSPFSVPPPPAEPSTAPPAQPEATPAEPSPFSAPAAPAETAAPTEGAAPAEDAAASGATSAPETEAPAGAAAPAEPAPPAAGGTTSPTGFKPVQAARPIKVGDVLNHIFEVKRFLARGGMGEVFEGCNVNTDERVAIKVMLPAMAADEKVVAMFRKEARTLTKLQHEALVQYRVLAQEPQLGVLYIVTEFIEGVELADMLGKVERTPDELAGLLRRLASGLAAAHRLGAIHRDMSPDNVLLPSGDVHQATIIDFGIAKDLDASSATIVGDGFAGKLNYVAPEQLGDYGREIGPWTDVYSLALVILAVAQGKNVDMSGSLVDAIDKRRKGPDLSAVPANLRGLIEDMLKPDPKQRLRSMDEVLARLGGGGSAPPPPPAETTAVPTAHAAGPGSGPPKALLVIGVLAVLVIVAAGIWYLFRDVGGAGPADGNEVVRNESEAGDDPVATARSTINSVLPSVNCTWLDISGIERGDDGLNIALRGVAGDSAAAQREISQALGGAGLDDARLDFGDVAPITPAGCAALDTYRQVRASSDYRLSVQQSRFEMVMQPPGTPYAGEDAANAVINFNFGGAGTDFAILGIEPSGAIAPLIADRNNFEQVLEQSIGGRPIFDEGGGRYRLSIDLDHQGWSGIILVTGQGPFDTATVAPPFGSRGPAWQQEFLSAAAQRDWRVEMVWFESVNRVSGDSASAAAAPAADDKEP